MSSPEHKKLIWDLIKPIKVGMLTTVKDGVPHARPMHLIQDEYDGKIWFFTEKNDAKTYEIEDNRQVCISFSNPEEHVYVSLTGAARLSNDEALKEKFSSLYTDVWFPDGEISNEPSLIEVKIRAGEHWDGKSSSLAAIYQLGKAKLTDTKPDMGENEKFGSV